MMASSTTTPQEHTRQPPLPSRNPLPLSATQEAQVRELYYKNVRVKCADAIKGELPFLSGLRSLVSGWRANCIVVRIRRLCYESNNICHLGLSSTTTGHELLYGAARYTEDAG